MTKCWNIYIFKLVSSRLFFKKHLLAGWQAEQFILTPSLYILEMQTWCQKASGTGEAVFSSVHNEPQRLPVENGHPYQGKATLPGARCCQTEKVSPSEYLADCSGSFSLIYCWGNTLLSRSGLKFIYGQSPRSYCWTQNFLLFKNCLWINHAFFAFCTKTRTN